MKKKVLIITLVLAIAVGAVVFRPSFAWVTAGNGGNNKSQSINIGKFNYNFKGSLHAAYINESSTEYVAPGENLIYTDDVQGSLQAWNFSTITTSLRVKITYSQWNGSALETVPYDEDTVDFAVKDSGGTLLKDSDQWEYNSTTESWNYVADPLATGNARFTIPAYVEPTTAETTSGETTSGETSTEATTGETTTAAATGDPITLITYLGYSDSLLAGNPYEDEDVRIKLTVEAKQANYATWEKIYEDYNY